MRYVAGFMVSDADTVLLVRKRKPAWQAGKLNGIGGKVEPGETWHQAMRREWREETGDTEARDWQCFARKRGRGYEVRFFLTRVHRLPGVPAFNATGEHFRICHVGEVIRENSPVIPDVPCLLLAAVRDPQPLFLDVREVGFFSSDRSPSTPAARTPEQGTKT